MKTLIALIESKIMKLRKYVDTNTISTSSGGNISDSGSLKFGNRFELEYNSTKDSLDIKVI